MSLKLVVGEDFPRGHWMLDSYPLLDCSGYERNTSAPVLTNLIKNPRVAVDTTGWTAQFGTSGSGTSARVATGGIGNLPYFEMTWTVPPGGGNKRIQLPELTGLTAGDKYTFSAWVKCSSDISVGLLLDYYNTAGGFVSLSNNIQTRTITDWTLITLTGTIPATATRMVPMIQLGGTATAGLKLAATHAIVTKTDSYVPYFDGDSKHPQANLVPNPYGAPGDWQGRWFGGGSSAGVMSEVTGPTPVGDKFKRKTWTVKGTTGGDTGFDIVHNMPVIPGQTYTASGWMRPSAVVATRNFYAGIYWYNAANAVISRTGGQNARAVTAGEWSYHTTTAVAPAGAVRAGMQLDVQGGAAAVWEVGDYLDGTGASFTNSTVALPLDSYTPKTSAWTGTAHNSNSTSYNLSFGSSLVKGAERSLIVNNSNKLTFTTTIWKQGKEYRPFSVEAFVRPIQSDSVNVSEQQIFGNEGVMDGLVMNDGVVSFVTKYTNGTEARASYDLMDLQSFAAVGIHTARKNILYINGDQVAEVEITDEQQASTFVATGAVQSSGASTSSNSFMLNSVSVYDLELDEESAMTHYANAQDALGAEDVAVDYKGALLEFAPEGALAPFFQIEYSSESEWALGHRVNCAINDGTLYPAVSQGVSVAGYWETVVPLGLVPSNIYAANLLWEGTGATVSTSRDGIEWTPAQKGKALTTVPKGTSGTGEFLYIRVAFPGGYANDLSSFDNMVFSLYNTGTITNFSGREVILDKATPEDDLDVIDYHENWGVELEAGTLTIKAPVGDMGVKARTIEVWGLKGNTGTFTNNLTSAARVRSNGGAYKPWANGEWQLQHYIFDADFTGDIVFSGTGQIGHVVIYPQTLSDAVIKEIYDSYTGKPKIYVDVDEVFDIHEFNGQVDIYEYDWSIESSG